MISSKTFPTPPPPGYVQLVLCTSKDVPFFLEIPINVITRNCKTPRKYLRFVGWCILGVEGTLADKIGRPVPLSLKLGGEKVYQYIVPGGPLAHAVDVEVIERHCHFLSESTGNSENFSHDLLLRDGCCVWSGFMATGTHLFPFNRGDEARSLYRPRSWRFTNSGECRSGVNDIRNGIYVSHLHHGYFDQRQIAVLKTPNPILETTDIPDRHIRGIRPDLTYPDDSRYTLQWLASATLEMETLWNNNDATFKDQTLPKPSDVLLHYSYGAAAVKQWGKNVNVLAERPGIPRPAKRPVMTSQEGESSHKKKKTRRSSQEADSEAQNGWDEDDVMLFFWGNSKAARERREREEQERRRNVEEWRTAVTGSSSRV